MARFTRYFVLTVLISAALTAGIAAAAFAQAESPLDKKYDVVLLQKADIDPKLEADYPTAAEEYRASLLADLREKNRFKEVAKSEDGSGKSALLVKSKITTLRIVSGAARFWGGPWAGSSEMAIELKFVDSKTGDVVREKVLTSSNNPWAASWTFRDGYLPSDMGKIVSAYILAIVPEK